MRWQDPPVTANDPGCEKAGYVHRRDPDHQGTRSLFLHHRDPGVVRRERRRAPFVFAHTYCVQGREPGQIARLELGVAYSEPGSYVVAAVAYSHRRCLGHEDGDSHPDLHSRIYRLGTDVEAAA